MRSLCFLAAFALAASCQGGAHEPGLEPPGSKAPPKTPMPRTQTDNTAQDYQAPPLPKGKVILPDAYGGRQLVEVEIATTPRETERGMMWRKEAPPGTGMLFVFEGEEDRSFWMRNTLIPLDIIFLTSDGTVAGVIENAKPLSLESRTIGRPSHYVLEVHGGWSAKVGLRTGVRAEIEIPEHLKKP